MKADEKDNSRVSFAEIASGVAAIVWMVIGAVVAAHLCGGCTYPGGRVIDGTNFELGIAVPGTDYSLSMVSYTAGLKVAANTNTAITVTNEVAETNSYFGVVHIERHTKMGTRIEPTEKSEIK